MQRQRDSQTADSRNHRQNLQEKPGEKIRRERERLPGEYASGRTGTNGRNYAGRRRRLAGWARRGVLCARYQVYTRYIYDPPIVPPSPMQEPPAIPAKSTDSTTSTAGRQPAPASTSHQHHQRRGQSHTAQNHQHQQTAHTTAPQPAPAHATPSQHHTRPGRSARRRRRPARRSPPARPGGRRYSRRGL